MLMNAFSPLNGGNLDTYQYRTESPLDLDAGLDFTRYSNAMSPFPFPVLLGYIEGVLPLHNNLSYQTMLGKLPTGPWVGHIGASPQMIFPNEMGSLLKVSG